MSMKIPLTPAEIEPATYRFVAQHSYRGSFVYEYFSKIIFVIISPGERVNLQVRVR